MERQFNPGSILLKFKDEKETSLLPVIPGTELSAREDLQQRGDLVFVELDALMTRQFIPNDERLSSQWHHATIASSNAWSLSTEASSVRIAIVDTPFQMNHPDLAPNTVPGWDIVNKREITSDAKGFFHSTLGAGMAAAAVNNTTGVAGATNAKILPVNINGYLSEMANAINWCAENNVRVVNLSWDGAYSSTLKDAAENHRAKTDGVVIMSGVNSRRFLDYPNQPFIIAISMTDSADLTKSAYGRHIDFAAPGWNIYSTTTNSFYENDSGSSYSAPLVAGIAAALMAINPSLAASEIENILKSSAVDIGPEFWDQYYGWGRINFGKAALLAASYLRYHQTETDLILTAPFFESLHYKIMSRNLLEEALRPLTAIEVFTNSAGLNFMIPLEQTSNGFFQLKAAIKE